MASVAHEILNRYPNADNFLGILPYGFVGLMSTFHLYFAHRELVTYWCEFPTKLGSLKSQLEQARAAWPPKVDESPGRVRRIPYADIRRQSSTGAGADGFCRVSCCG